MADADDGVGSPPDEDAALIRRIARQFSDAGQRAAVWRALDLVVEPDAYLNLGYSRWYQSHVIGSPQRRLVDRIGQHLAALLPTTDGADLLDVGCGRGGPAVRLARTRGFHVTGVDLVPHNVRLATVNADVVGVHASFLVGEATRLPVRSASVDVVTAIDCPVYVADDRALYAELYRTLRPGGVAVVSDLVAADGLVEDARTTVDTFADAWDMPPLSAASTVRVAAEDAGFESVTVEDISRHSVSRFRTWARLFLWVAGGPLAPALRRVLATRGIDLGDVVESVRAAEAALPHLRHVIVGGTGPDGRLGRGPTTDQKWANLSRR